MKFPILSTFFAAVLAFVVCAYVGNRAAAYVSYHYKESVAFASLGPVDAPQFRQVAQSLSDCVSPGNLRRASAEEIPLQISCSQSRLAKAPEDVRPILNLRIATGHAVLARLDEQAGKPDDAADERAAARPLLLGLGWKDVSDDVLNAVADGALHPTPRYPF